MCSSDLKKTVYDILTFLGIENKHEFKEDPQNSKRLPITKSMWDFLGQWWVRKLSHIIMTYKIRQFFLTKMLSRPAEFNKEIDNENKLVLEKIYRDEIPKLESLLGKKLPWKFESF